MDSSQVFSREYEDYIQSDEWREKANQRKAMDMNKCRLCGSTNNLQVHHITYKRLGSEDLEHDLVTLCKKCHEDVHENKGQIKGGIITGILIIKIDSMKDRLEGFFKSIGIHRVAGWAASTYRERMRVLYIPVPTGGAIVVPFADGLYSEKDARKMCKYVNESFEELQMLATNLYYAALETGGYVDTIPKEE